MLLKPLGHTSNLNKSYHKIKNQKSPTNKLPISIDPIADFVYGTSGLIIAVRAGIINVGVAAAVVVVDVVLSMVLLIVKGTAWTILANILTYGWFAIMLITNLIVWYVAIGHGFLVMFGITVVVFYALFFVIKDEARIVRKR